MLCPKCKSKTSVKDSRFKDGSTHRRRACMSCSHSFTTREVIEKKVHKPVKPKPKPSPKPRSKKRKLTPRPPKVARFEDLDFDAMTDEEIEAALDDY